ncbi:hypothetical protein [Agromyces sp. Marseille-Q5079]|uniref:hypothetical protein n=1 Tax=Agromyces sp. Marseille-Q5079 TaxID=3439059 RepID=UPI003D9C982C
MGTDEDPAPVTVESTPTSSTKKRWWVVGGGIVVAAFLGALGTWLFARVAPILDGPFESAPVEVYVDDSEAGCDKYAIPRSILEDVPVVPIEDRAPQLAEIDGEWVVQHGGLPTETRLISLTLHGTGDEAVVIHSIDLVDFERVTPGEDLIVIYECLPVGGEMDVTSLTTDFGSDPPTLEPTDPELRLPYQISSDDPEAFELRVSKAGDGDEQACFCRWNIGIMWSAGSESGDLVVEGDTIGVATAITSSEWQSHWFIDGGWTTELVVPEE